jgi:hypothetical protein
MEDNDEFARSGRLSALREVVPDERMSGMETWERKVERIWNGRTVAFVLGAIGAGCAVWANIWLPLPGVSVAILGAMVAIMSLRPKMGPLEKSGWILIIFVMLLTEIHSIRVDRVSHDAEQKTIRDAENAQFAGIACSLRDSITTSNDQYSSTITHVEGVLSTTQFVAGLAKKNLQNVTGGNSFAYLVPQPVEGAIGYSANLFNGGKEVLTGITVRITPVRGKRGTGEEDYWIDPSASHAIPMNTLGPNAHALLSDYWVHPLENGVLITHFLAIITAQNGDVYQDIFFRPAAKGKAFAFRFTVKKLARAASPKSPPKYKTLKTMDWTEPKPL